MKNQSDGGELYSSRIVAATLELLEQQYSEIERQKLLEFAEIESYQVADEGHFFSGQQMDRLFLRIIQLTGNKRIRKEVGRYLLSENIGRELPDNYIMKLKGPIGTYERLGKLISKITNWAKADIKKISKTSVEITIRTYLPSLSDQNRSDFFLGMMEAVPLLLGLQAQQISKSQYRLDGWNCFCYVVSWTKTKVFVLGRVRNFFILGGLIVNLVMLFFAPRFTAAILLPFTLVLVLTIALIKKQRQISEFRELLNSVVHTADELHHQMEINYNNIKTTHEMSQVINHSINLDELVNDSMKVIKDYLDFDRGLILLVNEDASALYHRQSYGYSRILEMVLKTNNFKLNDPLTRGVYTTCFNERRPFLINDTSDVEKDATLRELELTRNMGSQTFICCPIVCDNEALGVLSVDNLHSQRPLVQSDIHLLMGIASSIGVGIKKIKLLEKKTEQISSIIEVLASSIEARDPLTAGHSQKVTEYTEVLCEKLALPTNDRKIIRIAALLHDYGKIGIPDSVLKKNGTLTDDEYTVIKTHVSQTVEILNRIQFDEEFSRISQIAGAHHEKMDGTGYPRGLSREEIPLGARIIAVADFYEAITSKRHYRDPMPFPEALETLLSAKGAHLDPDIVDILVEYLCAPEDGVPIAVG